MTLDEDSKFNWFVILVLLTEVDVYILNKIEKVIFHISLGLTEQARPINVWKIMQREEEEWSLWVDTLDTGDRILDTILDNAHYNTLDTWDRMLDDNG